VNKNEVNSFIQLYAQIEALYTEVSLLSKKNPNDGINKFKLKYINKTLDEANNTLKDERKPFSDFAFFEEDNLPTNSDVTMILSQYLSCLEELRSANIIEQAQNEWFWLVNGKGSPIRTSPPSKLRR
jgi:hypothetical protein